MARKPCSDQTQTATERQRLAEAESIIEHFVEPAAAGLMDQQAIRPAGGAVEPAAEVPDRVNRGIGLNMHSLKIGSIDFGRNDGGDWNHEERKGHEGGKKFFFVSFVCFVVFRIGLITRSVMAT
jgi:hypothetical protein